MRSRREEVSQLLGRENSNSSLSTKGFSKGYGGGHQDVLIGAFLTSYTNTSVTKKNINPISALPLPNWTMNYNGLNKFEFFKKRTKTLLLDMDIVLQ